jgi:hypothetical protein
MPDTAPDIVSNTASPAASSLPYKPGLVCGCKAIRRAHVEAALAFGPFDSDAALYAASLAIKKQDTTARITGREDRTVIEGGDANSYYLGCCREDFVEAAGVSRAEAPAPAPKTFPVFTIAAAEPRFPKDSCYTCDKVAAGLCTPTKPLACG